VHAPTEDKSDDTKDSFYKKSRERRYFQTIGNESLNEVSNDNGIRVVNFATSKS
jgi:hypothetical protein